MAAKLLDKVDTVTPVRLARCKILFLVRWSWTLLSIGAYPPHIWTNTTTFRIDIIGPLLIGALGEPHENPE